MAGLSLIQVSKEFHAGKKRVAAVNGIDLDVADGELLVLVGPSGCGKSTLLRLIAGLETLSSGEIWMDGQRLDAVSPKDRNVAMVFQNYALFPHLTVFENLAFGLKFRGTPKAEIVARVQEAARLLQLEDLLDRKPSALSGGQRQRTALGRALVRRPKVFLLDEPLSNLDAQLRTQMRTEIANLHRQTGATMVYVTHDQAEAMTLGGRVCVLADGRMMQAGTPLEVYRHPANAFVAGFLGSPGMNMVRGRLCRESGEWAFEPQDSAWKLYCPKGAAPETEQEIILGIRPEDVRLQAAPQENGPDILEVQLCEALGHETLVHLGAVRWVARIESGSPIQPGDRVRLSIHWKRAAWFDPDTGVAIKR